MTKQIEIGQLKALSPLASLKKDNLHALVKKTKIRDAQPGEALFREGDSEKRTVYVLSGTIELRERDKAVATIRGGTGEARNPLCCYRHRGWRRSSNCPSPAATTIG